MNFHEKVKGKITINIDKVNDRLNSSISLNGLANEPDVTTTTLLVNFVSYAIKNGKDPKKIISSHLDHIISFIENK